MKYFTNRLTKEVFGYQTLQDAEGFDDDFDNLVEMTDELFQEFREQKPGHKWSLSGWVEDEELIQEITEQEQILAIERKRQKYFQMEATIQRLERIRERNEAEQAELDTLIDESTALFREIRAEKAVSMNEEGASE